MLLLITGIIASTLHVIAGPDHLAAVTPLAIENKNKSWMVGISWGIGHVFGMLLIGALFILFKEYIPVEAISEHSEKLVGIVLVLIGIWAIIKAYSNRKLGRKHSHPHVHLQPKSHVHIHAHKHSSGKVTHQHTHLSQYKQNNIAAFLVGTLHGLAGISHLLLILPTLALPTVRDSILYLVGFGIGTIAAMAIYASILGLISLRTTLLHKRNLYTVLRLTGGSFAILVGVFWFFSKALVL